MGDRSRMRSMYDVAMLVKNVNAFVHSLQRPRRERAYASGSEIIAATTSPPQRKRNMKSPKREAYVGEEEEENAITTDEDLDFYEQKRKELERFYDRLIYDVPDGPKTTKRTAELAQPKKVNIISLDKEYGPLLQPKGRRQRVKRRALELSGMTTEELQEHLKKQESLQKDKEKIRKKRAIVYRRMLNRLQAKCQEKFLDDVFKKFSKYISRCSVALEGITDISPSNVQRLVGCIEYNIYTTCKVTAEDRKINGALYRSIAACITWMIVETLFIAQSVNEKEREVLLEEDRERKTTKIQKTLQKRAMLATNKKQGLKLDEKTECRNPPPTIDELLKLSKMAGCR